MKLALGTLAGCFLAHAFGAHEAIDPPTTQHPITPDQDSGFLLDTPLPDADGTMEMPDAALWKIAPDDPAAAATPTSPRGSSPTNANAALSDPAWHNSGPSLWQRTALRQWAGVGERFTDGPGGVPTLLRMPLRSSLGAEDRGFHIGNLDVLPTLGFSVNYTHTKRSPNQTQRESLFAIDPSFIARLGDLTLGRTLAIDYTASLGLASGSTEDRTRIDQQLTLDAKFKFTKLELGLNVEYAGLSGQDRDVGREIERNLATAALTSRYELSPKTSVAWDVSFPFRQFSGGIGSGGVTSDEHVDYQYSPKTTVGIGITTGYLSVEEGSAQTFEQANLRTSYDITSKVHANLTVGYEFRQVESESTGTPIFSGNLSWTIREGTQLELMAERRVFNSAEVVNVNFSSTSAHLSFNQRLGSRVTAVVGIGYEHSTYQEFGQDIGFARTDDLFSVQGALNFTFGNRLTCSVTLAYDDNQSNTESYRSVRAGLQTSYTF